MRSWKASIGHASTAVSGDHDQRESPWCLQLNTAAVDEFGLNQDDRRFGLFEAPLALALYKICPPILQTRVIDKETSFVDADSFVLLTGRHIALMILDHFNIVRFRRSFISYSEMYHLAWAGYYPDPMAAFLRNWDLLIESMLEPKMTLCQQRYLGFRTIRTIQRDAGERMGLYMCPHCRKGGILLHVRLFGEHNGKTSDRFPPPNESVRNTCCISKGTRVCTLI